MVKKSQMPKMSISRDLAYFKSKVCEIHEHARQCNMVASIPLGFVLAEGCDSETEFADHFDTCVQDGSMGATAGRACQTSKPLHLLTRILRGKSDFTRTSPEPNLANRSYHRYDAELNLESCGLEMISVDYPMHV